jgi:hypothetical protein
MPRIRSERWVTCQSVDRKPPKVLEVDAASVAGRERKSLCRSFSCPVRKALEVIYMTTQKPSRLVWGTVVEGMLIGMLKRKL